MLTLRDLTQISPCGRHERFVRRKPLCIVHRSFQRAFVAHIRMRSDGRLIIRRVALGVISGGAVALEVDHRYYGDVNGQLLIVDPKTVTLSIRVREHSRLQDRVRRRLDVRNQMRRRECSLIDSLIRHFFRVEVEPVTCSISAK